MAKGKVKIPKRVGGVKIKKRHRKQLRALMNSIQKYEELIATGSAIVALLGLGSHATKKGPGKSEAVPH